jgi:hypothetical protein
MSILKREKTPLLEPGLAKDIMDTLLEQLKSPHNRGLTRYIEDRGVNGKDLKPDMPYDMRWTKVCKILSLKATFQDEDDFLTEWMILGLLLLGNSRQQARKKARIIMTLLNQNI